MKIETQNQKFRPGRRVSEFNPVPLILSQKTPKLYNILVGEDRVQERFAEQVLDVPCVLAIQLSDEHFLVDNTSKLFRVLSAKQVVISPQVRELTSFWSLDPIEKGSAGANAIVRYAATLLDIEKPDRDQIERLADLLATSGTIEDLRVALWTSVWLLTGDSLPESKRWPQPWEDSKLWFNIPGVTPEHRLNSLYLDLTAYTFTVADEEATLKKAGLRVSPSKLKVFKKMKLDFTKIHDTLKLLDLWRTKRTDPYICAFRVANIWNL